MTSELAAQLPELERQADEFERKAEAIRQIIAGVRALNGDADAILIRRRFAAHTTSFEVGAPVEGGPRGTEAILRVVSEAADRDWKVVDIKREVLRRGWAPTPKAVEASVATLRKLGRLQPTSYGHYRLAQPNGEGHTEEVETPC